MEKYIRPIKPKEDIWRNIGLKIQAEIFIYIYKKTKLRNIGLKIQALRLCLQILFTCKKSKLGKKYNLNFS